MRKWLRNRKRWAFRRRIVEHQRVVDRLWLEVAACEGRKQARLAALPVRLQTLLELDEQRRVRGDGMLAATCGIRVERVA